MPGKNRLRLTGLAVSACLAWSVPAIADASPRSTGPADAGGASRIGSTPAHQALPGSTSVSATPTAAQVRAAATNPAQRQRLLRAQSLAAQSDLARRVRQAFAQRHLPVPALPGAAAPTGCDTNTDIQQWVAKRSAGMTLEDSLVLTLTQASALPQLEALFATSESQASVDVTGHGPQLQATFAQLSRFWTVDRSSVMLTGMSGTMLASHSRVQAVYQHLGLPKTVASLLADVVVEHTRRSPWLDGGRNPLLTFNALAVKAEDGQKARIIMGEGILRAYDELGRGQVAPQVVLAHEFGHQVQFRLGMDAEKLTTPAATTRRLELHADASASYFVSSPRGGRMDAVAMTSVMQVLYGIGDCNTNSSGHHGTPAERQRAAQFGLRQQKADTAHGLAPDAARFRDEFARELPSLLDREPATTA